MRRILSTTVLCMLVSLSFAQKKNVKEAKNQLNSDKLTEAKQLITPALTDPETISDPETWKVLGDIGNKAFENEQKKQILGKTPDETVMYTGLMDSYDPYIKADELGQIPDEKGKIKNKFRKDIAATLRANHAYFINGGIFYNEKKDYSKAADFFQKYWELPDLKVFEGDKTPFNTNDSSFQVIKYYAVICAIQADEHPRAIELLSRITKEPFATNSTYTESSVYELLASEYQQVGDSVKFLQTLEDGAKKFPTSNYFVSNLINSYINKQQYDEAIAYLDKAIANDSGNTCEFNSVKASVYIQKSELDKAFASYNDALSNDPNCARALDGLARAYIFEAQNLKEKASSLTVRKDQVEMSDKSLEYYKKAYPLLEKYKSVLESQIDEDNSSLIKNALYLLSNVYDNLNMADEYNAALKAYEAL